jgi:hypothetical protein
MPAEPAASWLSERLGLVAALRALVGQHAVPWGKAAMRGLTATALLTALATLLLPASAIGQRAPPQGNSGVSQYLEVVPTAGGGRPSGTLHGGGGPGSPSISDPTGGNHSGSPLRGVVAPATRGALRHLGPEGRGVLALAAATAPVNQTRGQVAQSGSRAKPGPGSTPLRESVPASTSEGASSPLHTLARALTGSSTHGGLGTLLPVIMAVAVLGAGLLAVRRHRRRHTA